MRKGRGSTCMRRKNYDFMLKIFKLHITECAGVDHSCLPFSCCNIGFGGEGLKL